MWNPLSKPKRKQNLIIVTEHKHLVSESLPVEKGFCVDRKTNEAWQIGSGTPLKCKATGIYDIFVMERDAAPLIFNGAISTNRKSLKDTASALGEEHMNRELFELQAENKRKKMTDALVILALVFGVLTALVIVVMLFQSGKVHLPIAF